MPNNFVWYELMTTDAKAAVARKTDQDVYLNVTTPVGGFGVQYADCGPSGKACKALAFTTAQTRASGAAARARTRL